MAKLLIYDNEGSACRSDLEQCLSKRHESVFVTTAEEVIRRLDQEKFDAVIANVYQENENVLGLLQRAKTSFWLTKLPFICFRGPDSLGLEEMDETLRMAMIMLGARGYVAANDYESVCKLLEPHLKPPKPAGRRR